jgi:TorA maturation chaperone TorD
LNNLKEELKRVSVTMRDAGLQQAINAAGGISELARKIGIAQPSVSNWSRIPAERVAAVEELTGVDRALLRPDLFTRASAMASDIDETDSARSEEYALLSVLLARAPDAELLSRLGGLRGDATPIGLAHIALGEAAGKADPERISREYFNLFIGLGRGELMPYGSYYLTGFVYDRPLARLRDDLAALAIARAEGNAEPEDHAAILCEIMSGVTGGRFPAPEGTDSRLFEKHMAPWIGRFFADLERAEHADFYRRVGALGRLFMELEMEAFAMPAEKAERN